MRAAVLLVLALAAAASAQVESRQATTVCRLPVAPESLGLHAGAARAPVSAASWAGPTCDPATEGARFEVTYVGFPPGAEASFQRAVDVWSCRIRSTQVIRVDASWEPLERGTLGSAGPVLFRNFEAAPTRDVWYPSALADHFAGRDLGDGGPDLEAFFNSAFADWHIGPGAPADNQYDLTTVVLHELAHGLGFIGALTVQDGLGRVGVETTGPFSYDLHTETAGGVPLLDPRRFPDRSVALAEALTGGVSFEGRAVRQAVGSPVPLFAPAEFRSGASYSHLDEEAFPGGTPDGLMTPFIAREEQVSEPGTAVCAILADVGWTLAGDCARRVGALPPQSSEIVVVRRGPNPFSAETSVEVRTDRPASLRATLFDVRGREVRSLGQRVVSEGRPWTLTLDGRQLASGVYALVIRGGQEPRMETFVVAR